MDATISDATNDATNEATNSEATNNDVTRGQKEPARPLGPQVVTWLFAIVLSALLAAGNVYTALKLSFIDGGSMMAALLGAAAFAATRQNKEEDRVRINLFATCVSAAAVSVGVVGLAGPIPALAMLHVEIPWFGLLFWGFSLAALGLLLGKSLAPRLVVEQGLVFPTGRATAQLIEVAWASRGSANQRVVALLSAGFLAAGLTWLRDGPHGQIPALLPLAVPGFAIVASVGFGVTISPVVAATGILMGPRGVVSLVLGGAIAWFGLYPQLEAQQEISASDFSQAVGWFAWPAMAMMVVASLSGLRLRSKSAATPSNTDASTLATHVMSASRLSIVGYLAATISCVLAGVYVLELSPFLVVVVLVASFFFVVAGARATGETDLAPVGALATAMQGATGFAGASAALSSAAIPSGLLSQAVQVLWNSRAAIHLRGRLAPVFRVHALGSLIGVAVAVPVYLALASRYEIGSENFPAPGALTWKATALAVSGEAMTWTSLRISVVVAALLLALSVAIISRLYTEKARFMPSPAALAIGMLIPPSYSLCMAIAVLLALAYRRVSLSGYDAFILPIAAGAIAGESIMGVALAFWMAQ